jgi:hypothetical protein
MTCSKGARLPALALTFQGYNPFDSAIDVQADVRVPAGETFASISFNPADIVG